MCGLAGYVGAKDDRQRHHVQLMLDAMLHRGPDDGGIVAVGVSGERTILGSRRLAIIDLSSNGHMPMTDANTGNVIVYNGELYNFKELRSELQNFGHVFRSETDTEVILASFRHWGPACVQRFRGMFAFSIWDARNNELFIARDRAGEKPFYYASLAGSGLIFASEVRALIASGLISGTLDPVAIDSFLFNGFCVGPGTLLKSVQSLPAAHWMRVGAAGRILEQRRYWSFPVRANESSQERQEDILQQIRECFSEAVSQRLVSDVPLGIFLSGGLDSSLILAATAKLHPDVRTFAVGFSESRFDESAYAASIAKNFGSQHTQIILQQDEFSAELENALEAMDLPTFDGLNFYFVSKLAKENGLTVALTGLGADELFGGYPFFRQAQWLAILHKMAGTQHGRPDLSKLLSRWIPFHVSGWAKLASLAVEPCSSDAGGQTIAAYQTAQAIFPRWTQHLFENSINDHEATFFGLSRRTFNSLLETVTADSTKSNLSAIAFNLFLGERCLRDSDAMSMKVSLETRTPFTDHEFIRCLSKVPIALRIQSPSKSFEWKIAEPFLNEALHRRPKRGFSFPFPVWIRSPAMLKRIKETVLDVDTNNRLGLKRNVVEKFIKSYEKHPRAIPWSRPWALFVLCHWSSRLQACA